MNISKNYNHQTTPQFMAIKRVNCSLKEFLEINEKLSKNQLPILFFKNKSPHHADMGREVLKTANANNTSVSWVYENCKRHGIDLPDIDKMPLYLFTEKSIFHLAIFKLKSLFASIAQGFRNSLTELESIPQHLINIKLTNDFAEKMMPKFEKFLQKNNVEDISLEELKIFIEKSFKN